MKAAPFDYLAPDTVDETVALLGDYGEDARTLAGGQSLIPMLAMRMVRPSLLVDLAGAAGLDTITAEDGGLAIGPMVRQRTAERSPLVQERSPLLAQALPLVGHPAIRSRGTIGGSLAHAAPAAELPAVAVALDAIFVTRSAGRGVRILRAAEFFTGWFSTALAADELLIEIRIPAPAAGTGVAFEEVSRRYGDTAIVGVAVTLRVHHEMVVDARIVVTGVSDIPVRSPKAEEVLQGVSPCDRAFSEASDCLRAELKPPSDLHASSDYRRHVTALLVKRALRAAATHAGGEPWG